MNKEIESIESFISLLNLYLQQDFKFKETYKYSPEVYHVYKMKRALNDTHQMLNGLYIVFGAIILPLFLFFINKSWFRWFQVSYFLSYVFVVLLLAFVFYWIQKMRKQKQDTLINQMDASYKALKLYFDNHPEILDLYQNRRLEFEDAELIETFQEKIKKRAKMLQQIEKIIKKN